MNADTKPESLGSIIDEIDTERTGRKGVRGDGFLARNKTAVAIVAGLAVVVAVGFLLKMAVGPNAGDPGANSGLRVVMDAETGEIFKNYRIREGMSEPYRNPSTGKNTLYQPEACYWTQDGKAKRDATYVILNEHLGLPGPTVCPDCGRTVRPHNPAPPHELMAQAYESGVSADAEKPVTNREPDDGRR